ncbi:Acetyl xylan esterase (AXE1) [Singulisphaera sp. GP187]|uniref:alpha/beta hydrolase family protein n=1 Tax=Singulisphaera sp. GP187 TaxID=1882752 RepID=UPI0009260F2D|nr:alpha/beta hydrolase [Singulisphaera sp. GP187]SIO62368.1 Acetyl xylan esterase (AXE1) [Singulisphaera sp. GP187]
MLTHSSYALALVILAQVAPAETKSKPLRSPSEVRKAFLTMLDRPKVPLDLKVERSETSPDGFTTERLSFASENRADGQVERVPVLVVRPPASKEPLPAVIVLHGTGGDKEKMKSWLVELAERGIIGVAIDARYHGERAGGSVGADAYNKAITRAWRSKPGAPQEHPFYYDTCWDVWRTLDYLETRADVDAKRFGMIGISMGGIETWLAAAVDERVAVAVPAIAVQSFRWSLQNEQWQGRARSIGAAHQAAAKDLGEADVNARVCRALWNKVIPGILSDFDCPSMLRLFAGRPLLILNGDRDPNCPIGGARLAFSAAEAAYQAEGASDHLRILVAEGVAHAVTPDQHQAALDWFTRWLASTKPKDKQP